MTDGKPYGLYYRLFTSRQRSGEGNVFSLVCLQEGWGSCTWSRPWLPSVQGLALALAPLPSQWDLTVQGPLPPGTNMFKPVHYVIRTIGKWAIGNWNVFVLIEICLPTPIVKFYLQHRNCLKTKCVEILKTQNSLK